MRRIAALFGAGVAVVAIGMVWRTVAFQAPPAPHGARAAAPTAGDAAVDERAAAARLAHAVRIPTISWPDSAPSSGPLLALRRDLEADFPRVHAGLGREVVAAYSLLYTWRGSDTSLAPIVLMGHLDVVPVETAAESLWTHGPFSGDTSAGFIWGRGALDDKGSVLSTLEAVESLLAEGFVPARTVVLAFGHDEEVGGVGADSIVSRLHDRGVRPDFVLDEGSVVTEGIMPGVAIPVAVVGVTEKGAASVELTVNSAGGHSSMPPRETAVGVLAAAIVRLESHQFPVRFTAPTIGLFDAVAPAFAFGPRLAFANRWLFGPLIARQLTSAPATNAMMRTTTAPTMLEGSPKENVLAHRARAVLNFRILAGDDVAGVLAHVTAVVADPRVHVRLLPRHDEPSPMSGTDTRGYRAIAAAVQAWFPDAIVAPSIVVAATDSRHYARITHDIYRFLPVTLRTPDLARLHGVDERVGIADYARAIRFTRTLIRAAAGAGAPP